MKKSLTKEQAEQRAIELYPEKVNGGGLVNIVSSGAARKGYMKCWNDTQEALHENRDWCECGNCEPNFEGGRMCKNSKHPIYYPYK